MILPLHFESLRASAASAYFRADTATTTYIVEACCEEAGGGFNILAHDRSEGRRYHAVSWTSDGAMLQCRRHAAGEDLAAWQEID